MNASTSQGSPESWQPYSWSMRIVKLGLFLVFAIFLLNIGTLVLLSLGSGWSYPRLLPDQVDGVPWMNLFQSRSGILRSSLVSLGISSIVASVSTILGLWTGVGLRRARSKVWLYIAYLPFVLSPVTVGLCLLDMSIRLGLASTYSGSFGLSRFSHMVLSRSSSVKHGMFKLTSECTW